MSKETIRAELASLVVRKTKELEGQNMVLQEMMEQLKATVHKVQTSNQRLADELSASLSDISKGLGAVTDMIGVLDTPVDPDETEAKADDE